jgi:hypothetical protein
MTAPRRAGPQRPTVGLPAVKRTAHSGAPVKKRTAAIPRLNGSRDLQESAVIAEARERRDVSSHNIAPALRRVEWIVIYD